MGVFETIDVDGQLFEIVRRPYRRSLSLTVKLNGPPRVLASLTIPESSVRQFIRDNKTWIEKKQKSFETLRETHPPKSYVEGESFYFLGQKLELLLLPGVRSRVHAAVHGKHLVVWHPKSLTKLETVEIARAVAHFYKTEGSRWLQGRVRYWAERTKLQPKALTLRAQKTRWGSCSSRGRVSLNWRLSAAPVEVVDYVIVHELCHLRHANHSSKFWQLVEQILPHYEQQEGWLRRHHFDLEFLAN